MPKESIWKSISKALPASDLQKEESRRLLKEYEHRGYLHRLNRELIELPLEVTADFFYRLSLLHSSNSPMSRKRNPRWLAQSDITSFNVRGCGTPMVRGNFFQASMLLPAMRTKAIQLQPVSQSEPGNPQAILSHAKIDPALLHPRLSQLGFNEEDQLQCLVQAAHLCGLALGFDLSYQLSQEAEALYRRPELFRWISLDPERRYIPRNHLSYQQMLSGEQQEIYCREIREISKNAINLAMDRRQIHKRLRQKGYFPVPKNSENKGAIPLFIVYDPQIEEAQFTGSSEKDGLTSFCFYRQKSDSLNYQQATIDYFGGIFPIWKKRGFDFLFLEGAIGSEEGLDKAQQEGPDRKILQEVTQKAKACRSSIGVLASGEVLHLRDYLELGFDGLLDQQDSLRLDRDYVERAMGLQLELKTINQSRKIPSSLYTRISLAEHNSPSFNQKIHLEHFCCRFLNCGKAGRHKFEMLGINDGSAGYQQSIKLGVPLQWREDRGSLDSYHILEDIYLRHQKTLEKGEIRQAKVEDNYAWWAIQGPKEWLVALISVENDPMVAPPYLEIDLAPFLKSNSTPSILEYDFNSTSGNLILTMTGAIEALHVPYRGYRLYSLKQ